MKLKQWGVVNGSGVGTSRTSVRATLKRGQDALDCARLLGHIADFGPRDIEATKPMSSLTFADRHIADFGPRDIEAGDRGLGAGERRGHIADFGPRDIEAHHT